MISAYLVNSEGAVTCVVDNKSYIISKEHPNYNLLIDALKNNDTPTFLENYQVSKLVNESIEEVRNAVPGVSITDDGIFYDGRALDIGIDQVVYNMKKEGFNVDRLVRFIENLMENPSSNSVNQLFRFLEIHNLAITEDGCFLAYKAVQDNYRDKYSGKYDNTPGSTMSVLRNQVDDNPRNHCSHGFHVGALGYSGPGGWYNSEGDKTIIVKVNPQDVVCVPEDHSCQKMRVCRYEVISDFQGELNRTCYSGKVGDDYTSKSEEKVDNYFNKSLKVEDMLIDETYEFDYTKKDGSCKRRYAIVDEILNDRIICILEQPELNEGDYRGFKKERISNIKHYQNEYWDEYEENDED